MIPSGNAPPPPHRTGEGSKSQALPTGTSWYAWIVRHLSQDFNQHSGMGWTVHTECIGGGGGFCCPHLMASYGTLKCLNGTIQVGALEAWGGSLLRHLQHAL